MVSFAEALRFWLKLGFISFGGPAGQIAIMHRELVERRRWISERRFLHALNYCMLLPGPEAQQLATYIGWLMHRTWGGIVAGALFVLPSLFILIALSWVYMAYGQRARGRGHVLRHQAGGDGDRAAGGVAHRQSRALQQRACCGPSRSRPSSPSSLLRRAVPADRAGRRRSIGLVGGRLPPAQFAVGGGHARPDQRYGPALIDDDTPTPAACALQPARGWRAVVAGRLALLGSRHGCARRGARLGGTLAQMAWFFTKAALLTFGGAYAVLPYVYQGAVEQYHWLTRAADDRRPGARRNHARAADHGGGLRRLRRRLDPSGARARTRCFLAGALAACVVTWFTFLPSFVFILAGGPLVESTHGDLQFTAPLTAITAAVVGVIVSLAVFFARHVLPPASTGSRSSSPRRRWWRCSAIAPG